METLRIGNMVFSDTEDIRLADGHYNATLTTETKALVTVQTGTALVISGRLYSFFANTVASPEFVL